jgi:hypothetical protein
LFIQQKLTFQQSCRCRGLKVLVDLLDEDLDGTENQGDLVRHALNDISSVFDLQSPTTKNGFCRMFIREGLLDPLSHALGTANGETKKKVIQIFLMFSQVSQSDIHVRNALGTRKVVRSKLVWDFVLHLFISRFLSGRNYASVRVAGRHQGEPR